MFFKYEFIYFSKIKLFLNSYTDYKIHSSILNNKVVRIEKQNS